mmetsp:Transcript_15140/g.45379  ORF Transcript_15140/g.45379 Transcript_15140/m.45379 type:complete len:279 (+) Transcript_15140:368-1204(+)
MPRSTYRCRTLAARGLARVRRRVASRDGQCSRERGPQRADAQADGGGDGGGGVVVDEARQGGVRVARGGELEAQRVAHAHVRLERVGVDNVGRAARVGLPREERLGDEGADAAGENERGEEHVHRRVDRQLRDEVARARRPDDIGRRIPQVGRLPQRGRRHGHLLGAVVFGAGPGAITPLRDVRAEVEQQRSVGRRHRAMQRVHDRRTPRQRVASQLDVVLEHQQRRRVERALGESAPDGNVRGGAAPLAAAHLQLRRKRLLVKLAVERGVPRRRDVG